MKRLLKVGLAIGLIGIVCIGILPWLAPDMIPLELPDDDYNDIYDDEIAKEFDKE